MSCVCCSSTSVCVRSFPWSYIPRLKDQLKAKASIDAGIEPDKDHMAKETTLNAFVCDDCFQYTVGIHIVGWDWWDAVDSLCRIINDTAGEYESGEYEDWESDEYEDWESGEDYED